jgi:uncharacterized membrane-anchored protein
LTVVSAGALTDDAVELTANAAPPRKVEINAREGKVVMLTLPLWVRKFLLDTIETGLGAVLALTFVVPVTMESAQTVGILVAAAVAGAVVSAVRRAVPPMLAWLKTLWATE